MVYMEQLCWEESFGSAQDSWEDIEPPSYGDCLQMSGLFCVIGSSATVLPYPTFKLFRLLFSKRTVVIAYAENGLREANSTLGTVRERMAHPSIGETVSGRSRYPVKRLTGSNLVSSLNASSRLNVVGE